MNEPQAEWVDEDDDWDDPEWSLNIPWHVRLKWWLCFWKR